MGKPGVLTYQAIVKACAFDGDAAESSSTTGLVRPALKSNIRSASYDMRIGSEYYIRPKRSRGPLSTSKLEPGQTITLEPNALIIVRSHETLHLDNDMVGHLSLKMDLLRKGLIMASQSQVDAGYEGWIFILLYNLSQDDVSLKQGQSALRVEFVRLDEQSARPYDGDYQNAELQQVLEEHLGSSLVQMRRTVRRADRRIRNLQLGATATALVSAGVLVAILVALFAAVNDVGQRAARMDGELTPSLQAARSLRANVNAMCRELNRLERLRKIEHSNAAC